MGKQLVLSNDNRLRNQAHLENQHPHETQRRLRELRVANVTIFHSADCWSKDKFGCEAVRNTGRTQAFLETTLFGNSRSHCAHMPLHSRPSSGCVALSCPITQRRKLHPARYYLSRQHSSQHRSQSSAPIAYVFAALREA